MSVVFLIIILFSHFAYSENIETIKKPSEISELRHSLMDSARQIFQDDFGMNEKRGKDLAVTMTVLEVKINEKKEIDLAIKKTALEKCYYNDAWGFFKFFYSNSCSEIMRQAREEQGFSYSQMRGLLDSNFLLFRTTDPRLYKLLKETYSPEEIKKAQEENNLMAELGFQLQSCDYGVKKTLEDSVSCHTLIAKAKEKGLSYLQIKSVIEDVIIGFEVFYQIFHNQKATLNQEAILIIKP